MRMFCSEECLYFENNENGDKHMPFHQTLKPYLIAYEP